MAAAETMAAAARELVLRAGTSDMEEEEGPLVRARGCLSQTVVRSSLSSGRRRLGSDTGSEPSCYRLKLTEPSKGPEWPKLKRCQLPIHASKKYRF